MTLGLAKTMLIAIAGLWAGYAGFRQYEARQVRQPYAFNHAAHRVMNCSLCHQGAVEDIRASLPEIEICRKCHANSPLTDPKSLTEWDKAVREGGFRWKKLTSVPDHVFFSHRRHTKFGKLKCERCHSDMQNLTAPPELPMIRVTMDLCIDCHEELAESEDCARCHK